MASDSSWVAGGELGDSDKSVEDFKKIILDILQDGECITTALKRLKPPPKRTANKRKTRSTAKKDEDKAETVEDPEERAEKDRHFNLLTEAAGELMSLGFEDIYQDSRDDIAANLHKGADQGANRGGVVWHDDGTVKDAAPNEHAMYQRTKDSSALTFQESAEAAQVESDQPGAAPHQQIPTPSSAPIPQKDEASLNAAATAGLSALPDAATEVAEPFMGGQAASMSADQTHTGNGIASEAAATGAASRHDLTDAVPPEQTSQAQVEFTGEVPEQPAATDSVQDLPPSMSEAAAAAAHITQSTEPESDRQAVPAADTAKAAESGAQQPPAESEHAQAAAQDSEHKANAVSNDTPMLDGNTDAALDSSQAGAVQQPDGEASTRSVAQQGEWKGTAKGPGLGDSREFTGGPMNFERPKFRHAPYGPPPIRAGGRFALDRGRSSPRGRSSATGRSFGRGFSEPPRSSIMRPQYHNQPPLHMAHGAFPPQYGGYSPHPPPHPYQQQPPYYPPPQQSYPPPPQQGYAQYQGQPTYPAPPQQSYPPQQYAAQPPQYDAQTQQYDGQWQPQQYQAPQQYGAYQPPPAYPPAAAPPAE